MFEISYFFEELDQAGHGVTFSDFEDKDGDSSDLQSPDEGEGEREPRRFPRYKPVDEGEKVKFELGQIFSTKEVFRNAVKEYALQEKKDLKLTKNDNKRVVAQCVEDCPFYLRVSKTETRPYFMLVTFVDEHNCHRTASNRQAKTRFLARKFMPILRCSAEIKVNTLIEVARLRWGILITRHKAYRAKVKSLEMIQGACTDQYSHLRNYAQELLRSNPGSTVIIKAVEGPKGLVF